MKIIIPMAGEGSRFRQIGLQTPKFKLIAFGKSLFKWSMLSLSDFFECQFVFIYRISNDDTEVFIAQECSALGITDYKMVGISERTDGQASTVMLVSHLLQEDDAVCIYNIDTYVREGQIKIKDISSSSFGFIPAFEAIGDKWSFVKLLEPGSNQVVEVSEKVRISEWGSIGFYYFKRWADYLRIYQAHKEQIIQTYREAYIAPMYQYLIEEGAEVSMVEVNAESVHVLGTPEDLALFCPEYLAHND